jgi:hypothetical protein
VAAVGATKEDQQLVAHQLAAAAGEDGQPIDQARPVLLAALGGESSDTAVVWGHAGQDRGAALANRVGERLVDADFGDEGGMKGQGAGIIGWKGPV